MIANKFRDDFHDLILRYTILSLIQFLFGVLSFTTRRWVAEAQIWCMWREQWSGETAVSAAHDYDASLFTLASATVCLIWYLSVALVCTIGYVQLWRHYSNPPPDRLWSSLAPHVTIIRPIKGSEPYLYECLKSTLNLRYPIECLHIRFCVGSRDEPCVSILDRLRGEFPQVDVEILVEEEDQVLQRARKDFGPNPKIRNMSRAYREAIGDVVWIVDCNVWVAKGSCARMVARLEGADGAKQHKFVHQLPLVVETTHVPRLVEKQLVSQIGGGRLEEVFMSSAHAKFYTAINTVLVAPCIVGKSTMFRHSHLDALTNGRGIDYFSTNICEDHLIGDLLWRGQVPEEKHSRPLGKHALCFGDLAIQPLANMSLREYWKRRVRWLRVRKFTVTLATLVEPGTESFLCSAYGAFAATTLPYLYDSIGVSPTWTSFGLLWLLSVTLWCLIDWTLFTKLHSGASLEDDESTPAFALGSCGPKGKRAFLAWILAWIGREALTLPIWVWAIYGGTTVEWRGQRFWVGMDMKVHSIAPANDRKLVPVNGNSAKTDE